ncbi:hypothetical protein PHMEG_00016893 [Phytophthora megakarya]|uniref:Uncharacterized protein n=1 Tax=Phytophthora megakarya TaxID=4795 RepID=A0A225VZE0_9STRA|nr:hypothetical protein PHMEG_00016893 [Phytophthora megakarya]
MPMHEASDVTKFVQDFSPNGDIQELRDQLNECRAVILRSACVLLELRPYRKHFTKPNHVTLLVEYWQDTVKTINERENPPSVAEVASNAAQAPEVPPKAVEAPEPHFVPRDEGVRLKKRTREEVKEKPEKKKTKGLERNGNIFKEKPGAMAKSLEKAKVVKEWASAIEILSRVDGGADSITSIRALIDDVVESAADIRTDKLE